MKNIETLTIVIVIIGFIYFIPAFIAHANDKKNKNAITVLNIFLGWTLVGWVVALVWALCKDEDSLDVVDIKKCPSCAEDIKKDAIKCRYCNSDLSARPSHIEAEPQSIFKYHAKTWSGINKNGEIEAMDEKDAINKLQKEELTIISIKKIE